MLKELIKRSKTNLVAVDDFIIIEEIYIWRNWRMAKSKPKPKPKCCPFTHNDVN